MTSYVKAKGFGPDVAFRKIPVKVDSEEAEREGSYLWGLLEEMQRLAEPIFHEDLLEKIRNSYKGANCSNGTRP